MKQTLKSFPNPENSGIELNSFSYPSTDLVAGSLTAAEGKVESFAGFLGPGAFFSGNA